MKLLRMLSLSLIIIGYLPQGLYAAEERSAAINLPNLPSELIAQIAQHLPLPDFISFSQVNRRMHDIYELLKTQPIIKKKFIRDLWQFGEIKGKQVATKVSSFAISSDSSFIAAGHEDGSVTIIDARTGKIIKRLETGSMVFAFAISPDSSFIATGHWNGSIRLYKPVLSKIEPTNSFWSRIAY